MANSTDIRSNSTSPTEPITLKAFGKSKKNTKSNNANATTRKASVRAVGKNKNKNLKVNNKESIRYDSDNDVQAAVNVDTPDKKQKQKQKQKKRKKTKIVNSINVTEGSQFPHMQKNMHSTHNKTPEVDAFKGPNLESDTTVSSGKTKLLSDSKNCMNSNQESASEAVSASESASLKESDDGHVQRERLNPLNINAKHVQQQQQSEPHSEASQTLTRRVRVRSGSAGSLVANSLSNNAGNKDAIMSQSSDLKLVILENHFADSDPLSGRPMSSSLV